jgi:hypothetical protein
VATFQPRFVAPAKERAPRWNRVHSFDQAEADKLYGFAVRANSISAFIECSEEQRPKLRDAIIDRDASVADEINLE